MSPTVAFTTLGCRLNQVDTLADASGARGRRIPDGAVGGRRDVVVVNTCTVTARAEFSDRQAIRRAARIGPQARVVVTGCWAQTSPAAVAALAGVDLVVGNGDKARLPALLEDLLAGPHSETRVEVANVGSARLVAVAPPPHANGRARAFVKVQDGCQHRCAFCIVPFARGASRSLAPEIVEDQVRRLVAGGPSEIVLTGVDLGHYGADLRPRVSLAALLERLLGGGGLALAAAVVDPAILLHGGRARHPHHCADHRPAFHVPLQSGSDRVLA